MLKNEQEVGEQTRGFSEGKIRAKIPEGRTDCIREILSRLVWLKQKNQELIS